MIATHLGRGEGNEEFNNKMNWSTQKRKINDLIPYSANPRQMTEKQVEDLKKSLEKFDLVEIPAINTDNTILAGHQRLRIMQLLGRGEESIDVRVPDRLLTPEEVQEYNIRSNKNTGGWDFEILANSFELEDLIAWGFTDEELSIEFDKIKKAEEDDFDPNKAREEIGSSPMTQRGDIYQLGDHRLMCGDSTNTEELDRLMNGERAAMVFTDPPYNIGYDGNVNKDGIKSEKRKILNDKMTSDQFYQFLLGFCRNALRVTDGGFYICMSNSQLHTIQQAFTEGGGHWQTFCFWAKHAFILSGNDYQHQSEAILYGLSEQEAKKAEENGEDIDALPIMYGWAKHNWYGGRKQGDVWMFDRPRKSALHPTMKPVALCGKAISNSSKIGQIVLDLFGGSGSTLIACEQLSRQCRMMELDPIYCDVIVKRWEKYTGEQARLIETTVS